MGNNVLAPSTQAGAREQMANCGGLGGIAGEMSKETLEKTGASFRAAGEGT